MTGQNIINAAMVRANIADAGVAPSGSESAAALITLNAMLGSWSASGVAVPKLTKASVAMTGAPSYALVTRPLKILSASCVHANVHQDVEICSADRWTKIEDKSRAGKFARHLLSDAGHPTTTIYVTPLASTSTLELWTLLPLGSFATLATDVTFPDGYDRAIINALALELANDFNAPVTEALMMAANEAKTAIGRLNAENLGSPTTAKEAPKQ